MGRGRFGGGRGLVLLLAGLGHVGLGFVSLGLEFVGLHDGIFLGLF